MSKQTLHPRTIDSRFILLLVFLLSWAAAVSAQSPEESVVEWQSFKESLRSTGESQRLVFVDVYAPWCGWCYKMKTEVYTDPAVKSYLTERFETTRLNFNDRETTHNYRGQELTSRQLARTLKAETVPTVVLLDDRGEYILHLSGFVDASNLHAVLRYIGSGSYRTESYDTFLETFEER